MSLLIVKSAADFILFFLLHHSIDDDVHFEVDKVYLRFIYFI